VGSQRRTVGAGAAVLPLLPGKILFGPRRVSETRPLDITTTPASLLPALASE